MPCRYTIDPDADEPYGLDLIDWLEGAAITDVDITDSTAGLSVGPADFDGTRVFAQISGGTENQRYHVTFHVTAGNREDDFTLTFDVRKR